MAYQYTVLPFGLFLAPHTFTKCMDAALSLLRQLGISIFNYLDDWLILAQSEDELLYHRSVLLSHVECLGLRVNFAKSVLAPSRQNSFLGTIIRHTRMCTGHSAACGFIQTWSPSPPQSVSEDAGPHGLSVFATSVGPALYAAPSVLAEILSSSTRLESRTPTYQGEPGLHCSSGPFEGPAVDRMGRAPGHSLQKDGCLGLRQTGLRALVEEGRSARSQPLCLRRQQSLTNLFFKGQGCIGPQLFQPSPLCFSPDRPDPAGNQANQGAEAQSYVSGPTLEEPELVLGAGAAAHCSPMDHSPEMRPPLSGKRNDLAPPARSMGATSLAS